MLGKGLINLISVFGIIFILSSCTQSRNASRIKIDDNTSGGSVDVKSVSTVFINGATFTNKDDGTTQYVACGGSVSIYNGYTPKENTQLSYSVLVDAGNENSLKYSEDDLDQVDVFNKIIDLPLSVGALSIDDINSSVLHGFNDNYGFGSRGNNGKHGTFSKDQVNIDTTDCSNSNLSCSITIDVNKQEVLPGVFMRPLFLVNLDPSALDNCPEDRLFNVKMLITQRLEGKRLPEALSSSELDNLESFIRAKLFTFFGAPFEGFNRKVKVINFDTAPRQICLDDNFIQNSIYSVDEGGNAVLADRKSSDHVAVFSIELIRGSVSNLDSRVISLAATDVNGGTASCNITVNAVSLPTVEFTTASGSNLHPLPHDVLLTGGTSDTEYYCAINSEANMIPCLSGTISLSRSDFTSGEAIVYAKTCTPAFGEPTACSAVRSASYSTSALATGTNILTFVISGQIGTTVINDTSHTVSAMMPYGTNLTFLSPTITVSEGATVSPASGEIIGFTNPVTYTVVSENDLEQAYTVTVTTDHAPSSEADILTFDINGQDEATEIDPVNGSISVVMPEGTSLTSLSPTITVSDGATVSPVSGLSQDFTDSDIIPVTYTVTAEDNSTQSYFVTVTTAPYSGANILTFTVPGQMGTTLIDHVTETVTLMVSIGTDVTNLNPEITISTGATISPAADEVHNFTGPVVYTVESENHLMKIYTVRVVTAGPVVYVRASATGYNDGSSWENAFTDLNQALELAFSGMEIWIASGTYYPSSYHDVDAGSPKNPRLKHFRLKKGVAVYGGFAGSETDRAERNFNTNITTISGDIGVQGDVSDNVYHLFYHPASIAIDNTAILDGVVISKGNANGTGVHINGAGIYNDAGSPHISNVVFEYNRASGKGAGIYNNVVSDILIEHSNFISNYSHTGGTVYNYQSTGSISFSKFEYNTGNRGVGSAGIGVFSRESDLLITDSEFNHNSGEGEDISFYGGAVCDGDGKLRLVRSSFASHHASAAGGAVFSSGTDLTVDSCTFTSNWCAYDGGAIYAQGATSTVIIKDSTFTGNYTTADSNGGGAIKFYSLKTAEVSGSVFAKNTTKGGGGGISADHVQNVNISYSTFYANKRLAAALASTTSGMGGAILVNSSNVEVSNNIFWSNLAYSSAKGNDLYIYNDVYPSPQILSTVNIANNNIQLLLGIGNDLGGNMEVDPLFIDAVNGDYNLNPESLCKDMGAYHIH